MNVVAITLRERTFMDDGAKQMAEEESRKAERAAAAEPAACNLITRTTDWAMEIVSHYICVGDSVVDATMGNGRDTAALARLVGPSGTVTAFDVQPQALSHTAALLMELGLRSRVQLILASHAHIGSYCKPGVAAVLFNLGYLPGGDKEIVTRSEETLAAATAALSLLKPGGLLAAVMYSGHAAGAQEKEALLRWAQELSTKEYHAAYISMWNQKKNPPEILLVTKRGQCREDILWR